MQSAANDEPEGLGRQVAKLREAAGMTHQALADAAGVARQTIRFLESHATPYGTSVETFLKLCRVLNADPCKVLAKLPPVTLPAEEAAVSKVAGANDEVKKQAAKKITGQGKSPPKS